MPVPVRFAIAIAAVVVALVAPADHARSEGQFALNALEGQIDRDYPRAQSILPEDLEAKLSRGSPLLLIDVRTQAEFAVSHVPGAVRVDPAIGTAAFFERFGRQAAGKTVVVYCSVGVRSAQLATRVGDMLSKAGASGVFNLKGGIFAWHNTGRPLVAGNAQTSDVHGYSGRWARYLDFENFARFGWR